MEEAQTPPEVVETDAQALQDAQAGYDKKTRGTTEPPVAPVVEDDEALDEPVAPQVAVAEQLKALKAQVQTLVESGADRDTVRKMHGDIGNINRTLQQLQALKKDAPANDELAAALESAEQVAQEFPEIAGPLVKAMRALQARSETQPTFPEQPVVDPEAMRQEIAIKAIDEVHPDRHTVKETPEFKAWFTAKTPEYQSQVTTTWNPAVLSQCFSDFKETIRARKRKQERLDAAATPQGVATQGRSTTLPDEAGFLRGYNRVKRLGT